MRIFYGDEEICPPMNTGQSAYDVQQGSSSSYFVYASSFSSSSPSFFSSASPTLLFLLSHLILKDGIHLQQQM